LISPGSHSSDLLERQLDIVDANLKGVIIGCHAAYPLLMQTPGALVVNMTASPCSPGGPAMATYAATQSAVRSLTEALDAQWRHRKVRALCMSPWSGEEVADAGSSGPVVLEPSPADVALAIYRIAALRAARAKPGTSPMSANRWRGQDRIASNCDDWSGLSTTPAS
jgi:NAD(P)-dependent dehydrogenase (short-subunit alcohol dehydrogenase family)